MLMPIAACGILVLAGIAPYDYHARKEVQEIAGNSVLMDIYSTILSTRAFGMR